MREWVQEHRWTLAAVAAGVAVRALFLWKFRVDADDARIYSALARNLLHHGTLGFDSAGHVAPSYIRLPGYPAFLAIFFAIFGEHTWPVLIAQVLLDICACFFVALLARELARGTRFDARSSQIFMAGLWLAALCPFTANYAALELSETLAVFFAALSLLLGAKLVHAIRDGAPTARLAVGAGLAIAAGILLRPDGGIILLAFGIVFAWLLVTSERRREVFASGLLLAAVALAPLVPWTARNWMQFHRFEPLAPRYANAPDEYVPMGFNHWVKTWMVEYANVDDIYWHVSTEVPGDEIDIDSLPLRAFDSPQERERTDELFDQFNEEKLLTPEIDAGFHALAAERIAHSRWRYYVCLPALRIADMWLRPRTEMLDIMTRWWQYDDDPHDFWWAAAYGAINLVYLLLALWGALKLGRSSGAAFALLIVFVVVRSLFLGTLENPEPRYTLECFPAVLALGAFVFARVKKPTE